MNTMSLLSFQCNILFSKITAFMANTDFNRQNNLRECVFLK